MTSAVGGVAPPALCFRCRREGHELFRVEPFALVRCPQCEQQFISPQFVESADLYHSAAYFERMNDTNRAARAIQRLWNRGRLRLLGGAIDAPASSSAQQLRLLEIGASWGLFLEQARAAGFHVAGSEFSTVAADRAGAVLAIEVQQGPFDASSELWNGRPFDAVCFWDVIEHVPDPAQFLSEVATVCTATTVVAFSCPNIGSALARLQRARWRSLKPNEHIWHFTKSTVRAAFADAGFEVMALYSSPLRRDNLFRFDSMLGVARRVAEPT